MRLQVESIWMACCVFLRYTPFTMKMHQFIVANREELLTRAREKVASRYAPRATDAELLNGVPLFLSQLTETLKIASRPTNFPTPDIDETAAAHGRNLLRMGFSVGQVVHDYGDVCQAITELALDLEEGISTDDFHTLNRCLDNAIAGAVTEYGLQRDREMSEEDDVRRGMVAHEQRNLLSTATLAYQMLLKGTVPIGGSTGAVLGRCLANLRKIGDRSLAEIRLAAGLQKRARTRVATMIEQEEVAAALDANGRGLRLTVSPVDYSLAIDVDVLILGSALSNILQNAIKFTRSNGNVTLRVRASGNRVLIEVEDECGGLPSGRVEEIFRPFSQLGADRTGLGLGLTIARQGVKANMGELGVRDLPGRGCVFTIDLPAGEPFPVTDLPLGKTRQQG